MYFSLMLFTAQFLSLEVEIKIKAIFIHSTMAFSVWSKYSCHALKYAFNGYVLSKLKSKLSVKICIVKDKENL